MLDWLCIGGGPCGTCAVGALLQKQAGQIGWIEAGTFATMGRLGQRYGSVPANTRNDRLVSAFSQLDAFEFEARQAARVGDTLSSQPPMATARLQLSIDALRDASEAMRESGRLAVVRDGARVETLSSTGGPWTATLASGDRLEARRVVLATGAAPRPVPRELKARLANARIRVLDHDDVVAPDRAARFLQGKDDETLAIVGGAHSGMLAAMNVLRARRSVSVYDRKPEPRFAEERDGWIKYDGTGLKGSVADFTRAQLLHAESPPPRIHFHQIAPRDDLVDRLVADGVTAVAFTWGLDRQHTLDVSFKGEPLPIFEDPKPHNVRNGRLAPGLYGCGIAFPEYWTDSDGFTEPRVGFVVHFLKHLDRLFEDAGC